ncbi:MAG: hypothetical protein ABI026_10105 [Gemmatimonadaceae bacterium]
MTHVTALLIQAAHVLPDTVITKQVPVELDTFQKIAAIASSLISIAIMVLAAVMAVAAWNFQKMYRKVNELLDRVYGDVAPLVRSATNVTEDAREIVAIVKGDVRQVQQTVAAANARLLKAVKEAEARLDEFNALIEVVQGEAESAFVNTASTMHGVRTGLAQVFDHTDDHTEEFEDGGDRNGTATGAVGANAASRPRHAPRRRGDIA